MKHVQAVPAIKHALSATSSAAAAATAGLAALYELSLRWEVKIRRGGEQEERGGRRGAERIGGKQRAFEH